MQEMIVLAGPPDEVMVIGLTTSTLQSLFEVYAPGATRTVSPDWAAATALPMSG